MFQERFPTLTALFSFFKKTAEKTMKNKGVVLKLIYSEKATKFCEIFTLLLTGTT